MNFSVHMITRFTLKTGTAIEVPKERAPANDSKHHDFQPNPEVLSFPMSKSSPCRRQVKRIALRLASQPPRSDSNPAAHTPGVRKPLILSREIKLHRA